MKYTTPRRAPSPYRRRRILWTTIALISLFILYLYTSDSAFWSFPSSLDDLGFTPSSSKAKQVADAKAKDIAESNAKKLDVQELHGLLHFVTAHADKRFNELDGSINVAGLGLVKVDPAEPIDLRVYSPDGDADWEQHLKALRNDHPLIVFSKTYCPHSLRAKTLLESYILLPEALVVELDTRSDGAIIQSILGRLTGRRTVPNILLQAESIGGADDIDQLDKEHELKSLFQQGGLKVQGDV